MWWIWFKFDIKKKVVEKHLEEPDMILKDNYVYKMHSYFFLW